MKFLYNLIRFKIAIWITKRFLSKKENQHGIHIENHGVIGEINNYGDVEGDINIKI